MSDTVQQYIDILDANFDGSPIGDNQRNTELSRNIKRAITALLKHVDKTRYSVSVRNENSKGDIPSFNINIKDKNLEDIQTSYGQDPNVPYVHYVMYEPWDTLLSSIVKFLRGKSPSRLTPEEYNHNSMTDALYTNYHSYPFHSTVYLNGRSLFTLSKC